MDPVVAGQSHYLSWSYGRFCKDEAEWTRTIENNFSYLPRGRSNESSDFDTAILSFCHASGARIDDWPVPHFIWISLELCLSMYVRRECRSSKVPESRSLCYRSSFIGNTLQKSRVYLFPLIILFYLCEILLILEFHSATFYFKSKASIWLKSLWTNTNSKVSLLSINTSSILFFSSQISYPTKHY